MSGRWIVNGEERAVTGHGESARRVVIQHTDYPMLRLLVDEFHQELQDELAAALCAILNKHFVQL